MTSATGSLQRRLLTTAFAFVLLALVGAGVSIGFILQRFVRGQIDGRLDDRILSLVSDLKGDSASPLSLGRDLDGPPFDRARSGWYWQIRRGTQVLRSASLEGRDLALPNPTHTPREDERITPSDGVGPWGDTIILRVLTVRSGNGDLKTDVVASAPAAALRGPVLEAFRTLAICLGLISVLLAGGALLQVRLGLRPLARLQRQLAEVRAGRRPNLPVDQPTEVQPLVEEMNALLRENATQLESARAHVANLAHGLKTPLATLSVALADRGADPDGDLVRLIDMMDRRVRHHLRRARAAAVAGPARTRTSLASHIDDLRTALLRIHAAKAPAITVSVPSALAVACDPQDLDEMLGNLVENACQWCTSEVRIGAGGCGSGQVAISIEDDGPGLSHQEVDAVLRRGRRLDETVPGSGFGLSITAELATLYGGSLALDRAQLGGLRARLSLPA